MNDDKNVIMTKEKLDNLIDLIGYESILKDERHLEIIGNEDLTEEFEKLKKAIRQFENNTGYELIL